MRFRTRAFLFTFVPAALVLGLSFLMVQHYVESTVRDGLRNSLRLSQRNVAQLRDDNSRQNNQLLKAFSSDHDLLTAVQKFQPGTTSPGSTIDQSAVAPDGSPDKPSPATPLETAPAATAAKAPLSPGDAEAAEITNELQLPEDSLQAQLLHFGVRAGVDFLMVSGPEWQPFTGAVRAGGGSAELVPLFAFPQLDAGGMVLFRGEPYQTSTVRLQVNGNTLGYLTLGERLKLSALATSTVLLHDSWIMQSDIDKSRLPALSLKLRQCPHQAECSLDLNGVEWISLPIVDDANSGWKLVSLVNVDDATKPVDKVLRRIFLIAILLSLVVTLLCSILWSRAIVQPIAVMVGHLHDVARTGLLPEFQGDLSDVREIKDLATTYNQAATTVRKGARDLHEAYVQFVFALANALDARDCYTAGHSKRVSDLACSIAAAMNQSKEDVERLQIGALLHDIGKIGIPDAVLQHPGKLSTEDFKTIKKHPMIGRRILQGVKGFAMYLPAVELHHENWDGTGYPKRQRGSETPLDARIIHVADAYDAMTTDRSYRKGMTHERAMDILTEHAGSQFDPDVVAALMRVSDESKFKSSAPNISPLNSSLAPSAATKAPDAVAVAVRSNVQDIFSADAAEVLASSNLPVC